MFGISSFSGFIQLYFNVPSSISLIVLFNMVPYPYTTRLASAFTIKEVKKTIPSQYSLKKGICFRVLGHNYIIFEEKIIITGIPISSAFQTRILFIKFVFSKKATKIDKIFTVDLTLTTQCQTHGEDFVNFCGLLRKYEL